LAVEGRIAVRVEAALEDYGIERAIVKAGSDAQSGEAVTGRECSSNLF
jgi:hypothetical protein